MKRVTRADLTPGLFDLYETFHTCLEIFTVHLTALDKDCLCRAAGTQNKLLKSTRDTKTRRHSPETKSNIHYAAENGNGCLVWCFRSCTPHWSPRNRSHREDPWLKRVHKEPTWLQHKHKSYSLLLPVSTMGNSAAESLSSTDNTALGGPFLVHIIAALCSSAPICLLMKMTQPNELIRP